MTRGTNRTLWLGRGRQGASVAELAIAWLLTAAAVGGLIWTTLLVARERRETAAERAIRERADELQREVTLILHRASRDAGLACAHPDGWSPRAVFRIAVRGSTAELSFENGSLVFDPNIAAEGGESRLANLGEPGLERIALQEASFRIGLNQDGSPNSSLALAKIRVVDAAPQPGDVPAVAERVFAVELKGR